MTKPTQPWRCPDPSCKYVGSPNIHILSLPPGHDWSVAQVVAAWRGPPYPQNWKGSEGV